MLLVRQKIGRKWEEMAEIKGFTTTVVTVHVRCTSIFWIIKEILFWYIFLNTTAANDCLSALNLLYQNHEGPSSHSKNPAFPKFEAIHTFERIYPSSKIEIFERWEFCKYGHMIHHWNRKEVF